MKNLPPTVPKPAVDFLELRKRLMYSLREVFYVYHFDTRTIQWEGAHKELFGYTETEMSSELTFWQEHIHPDDKKLVDDLYTISKDKQQNYELEYRFLCKDGNYIWINDRGIVHYNDEGEPVVDMGLIRSIDDMKAQELELSRVSRENELFFEEAHDLLGVVDADGYLLRHNKAWERKLGYSPEVLAGSSLVKFVHPQDKKHTITNFLEQAKGEAEKRPIESRMVCADGSIKWLEWIVRLNPTDQTVNVEGRETTATRMAQKELKHKAEALIRSNKELEQFAYVASHDLKEPLRMISSYVQLLQRRYGNKLDETAHQFIQFSVDGVTRMQDLINDLLEYSRVERRGKPFTQTDMNEVLGLVQHNLIARISETNAQIEIEELPTIKADTSQMVQLLQNLVDNAMKFRSEKTPIVKICAEERDKYWTFFVKDNGLGIKPEYAEKVFILFQRLNNREHYEGTGIGLAICKRIVERHNGQIGYIETEGGGTTFWFTIRKA